MSTFCCLWHSLKINPCSIESQSNRESDRRNRSLCSSAECAHGATRSRDRKPEVLAQFAATHEPVVHRSSGTHSARSFALSLAPLLHASILLDIASHLASRSSRPSNAAWNRWHRCAHTPRHCAARQMNRLGRPVTAAHNQLVTPLPKIAS